MLAALQTLIDSSVIDESEVNAILDRIVKNEDCDDSDRKRAALLAWSRDNGNKDNPDDVTESTYGDNTFDLAPGDYLVLTDDEADAACAERIKDSLWAFRPEFLSGETGIDDSVFTALADKCEGANDAVLSIIEGTCGIDEFVKTAASADGRGHFLSGYDGNEDEYGPFYIYRIN